MESNDLIRRRKLGENLNEVTGFVYDNFRVLFRWALLFILPCSAIMSYVIVSLPNVTSANWLYSLVLFLMVDVMAISLLTVIKQYYLNGTGINDVKIKSILSEMIKNVGMGVGSLAFIEAIYALLFHRLFVDFQGFKDIDETIAFYILIFLLVASMIPLFHFFNVIVYEGKFGFKALGRSLILTFTRPFTTIMYVLSLTFVGYLVPTAILVVVTIVLALISEFVLSGDMLTYISPDIQKFFLLLLFVFYYFVEILYITIAMMYQYGNNVEVVDNVTFTQKFKNFDNL